MQNREELVRDYCRAWSSADPVLRQRLLDGVWADGGCYVDPQANLTGRQELNDHIGTVLERFPGARFVPSSRTDSHHDKLRFAWRLEMPDGTVPVEGVDFGEVSAQGKLQYIVGFFGLIPPK